jgi:16S rRNA G527 N7-methylase RsmG
MIQFDNDQSKLLDQFVEEFERWGTNDNLYSYNHPNWRERLCEAFPRISNLILLNEVSRRLEERAQIRKWVRQ